MRVHGELLFQKFSLMHVESTASGWFYVFSRINALSNINPLEPRLGLSIRMAQIEKSCETHVGQVSYTTDGEVNGRANVRPPSEQQHRCMECETAR